MAFGGSYADNAAILKDMERGNEQPPNPYTTDDQSAVIPGYSYNPGQHTVQMTTMQPMQEGPIMCVGAQGPNQLSCSCCLSNELWRHTRMSQPDENGAGPDTTCALVISVLATLFCFIYCGTAAICVAWQARLQVLDRKFRHARHSLDIVWAFVGIAIFLGLAFWGLIIWYITLIFAIID